VEDLKKPVPHNWRWCERHTYRLTIRRNVLYPIPGVSIETLVKHLALIWTALLSLEEYVKHSHLNLLFHKWRKPVLLPRLLAARRPAARLAASTKLCSPGCGG
jgi:hypothetical protein